MMHHYNHRARELIDQHINVVEHLFDFVGVFLKAMSARKRVKKKTFGRTFATSSFRVSKEPFPRASPFPLCSRYRVGCRAKNKFVAIDSGMLPSVAGADCLYGCRVALRNRGIRRKISRAREI